MLDKKQEWRIYFARIGKNRHFHAWNDARQLSVLKTISIVGAPSLPWRNPDFDPLLSALASHSYLGKKRLKYEGL